jgi:hypothetical protein
MRSKLLVLFTSAVLVLGLAGQASAKLLEWHGTITTKLGAGKPAKTTGQGVASVNQTNGGSHATTVRLAADFTAAGNGVPVTDPEVTGTIKTIIVSASNVSGTFAPISGGGPLTQDTLAIPGIAKVCLVFTGCPNFLPLQLTANDGNTGVGVGGLVTVGGAGSIRISLENAPWTLGTGMRRQMTDNSGFTSVTIGGFIHGPASNTSSTALGSGVIQLITPIQVSTAGIPGQNDKLALFASMRIHFVPEPGIMLLLGSGVVGLALIGRSRLRK